MQCRPILVSPTLLPWHLGIRVWCGDLGTFVLADGRPTDHLSQVHFRTAVRACLGNPTDRPGARLQAPGPRFPVPIAHRESRPGRHTPFCPAFGTPPCRCGVHHGSHVARLRNSFGASASGCHRAVVSRTDGGMCMEAAVESVNRSVRLCSVCQGESRPCLCPARRIARSESIALLLPRVHVRWTR